MSRVRFNLVAIAALLLLTWWVYSPGVTGSLHFDDYPNLGALNTADSFLKKLQFVFNGQAGPLGRPLSLATFALQQEHWSAGLSTLLQTNVALHLITGIGVFLFSLGLASASPQTRRSSVTIANCTTALWLLSPFLASTQLMLVQRMTTLSGAFVFFGLAVFVWGRMLLLPRPRYGMLLIATGILGGTLLATLSKESGALLPLLALVVERTWLRQLPPIESASRRRTIALLLWVPSALILAYWMSRLPDLLLPGRRAYTSLERFLSQPSILWEYVSNLLLPRSASISPFYDDHTAIGSILAPALIASVVAWLVSLGLSYRARQTHPQLLFGLMFFLTAHLLESTIINLELYFAHRNYVPAFGIYFMVACGIGVATGSLRKILLGTGVIYLSIFCVVLWLGTSLWGQPRFAAEIWAIQQPDSRRANHYLANAYLEEGDLSTASRLLGELNSASDVSGIYATQSLLLCTFNETETVSVVNRARLAVKTSRHENGMGATLDLLTDVVLSGGCPKLTAEDIERVVAAALANPANKGDLGLHAKAASVRSRLATAQGDDIEALSELHNAYELSGDLDVGLSVAATMASRFKFDDAIAYLHGLTLDAPTHPVRRWVWIKRVDGWIELMGHEKALYEETIAKGLSLKAFQNRHINQVP